MRHLPAFALVLGLALPAGAHGGGYQPPPTNPGPGDIVPPAGPGGGAGGNAPAPAGPTTPGRTGPGSPGPATPSGGASGGPTTGLGPGTGPGALPGDWTAWQLWWRFNSEPYLDLRRHVFAGGVLSGSDEFFLGRGETGAIVDTLAPSRETIEATVVPAIVQLLERERNPDVLTAALVALARIGPGPDLPNGRSRAAAIRSLVGHANQEVAETAALALGLAGDERELGILIDLASNRTGHLRSEYGIGMGMHVSDRTRAFAAYGLGLLARDASGYARMRIARALTELLAPTGKRGGAVRASRPEHLPAACLEALALVRLPVAGVRAELDYERPRALLTREDQVRWLASYLAEKKVDPTVRAHVPGALAKLVEGFDDAHPLRLFVADVLVRLVERGSRETNGLVQSCVLALGLVGDADEDEVDRRIRRALAQAIGGADRQARFFSIVSLGQIAGRPGSGAGAPLSATADIRAFLAKNLARARTQERCWSALAVGVMERELTPIGRRSEDMLAALRAGFVEARSPTQVGAFSIALGLARDVEAAGMLEAKLDTIGDGEAKGHCAVALGLVDGRAAIPRLKTLLHEARYRPQLLRSSAIALGVLGDKDAVPDLVTMLRRAGSLSSQAAIASALGRIGDARSVEPLLALARDDSKTDLARGFAVVALGIVCDRSEIPWHAAITRQANYRVGPLTWTDPNTGTGVLDIL